MTDQRKTSFEDELLDQALEGQRVEEPRPGLEARVLARLETADAPRGGWLPRVVAVGVPLTLLIALAVYVFQSPAIPPTVAPAEPPRVVETIPPTTVDPVQEAPVVPRQRASIDTPPASIDTAPAPVETAFSPSPTFPAHSELSAQEAQLVRFVRSSSLDVLRDATKRPPAGPVQFQELSSSRLHIEPLRAPNPLSTS